MNWLDLAILAALGLGAYRGFSTGALRQVTGILGLILAFAMGVQLMQEVGRLVTRSMGASEDIAPVVGFVLVFVVVRLLVAAVVRLVEGLLKALHLTAANRATGGVLGAFQAALLVSLVFLMLHPMALPGEAAREEAVFYEPLAAVLPESWAWARAEWPHLKDLSEQFGERIESELFE